MRPPRGNPFPEEDTPPGSITPTQANPYPEDNIPPKRVLRGMATEEAGIPGMKKIDNLPMWADRSHIKPSPGARAEGAGGPAQKMTRNGPIVVGKEREVDELCECEW